MKIYYINAFTEKLFSGNPAAVVILNQWLPHETLQAIAIENNLPVTVFLLSEHEQFHVRWFTPDYELNLCGHGTLAAAYVVFNILQPKVQEVDFYAPSTMIRAKRKEDIIFLDLPARNVESCSSIEILAQGLGRKPTFVYQNQSMERYLAIFETEEEIRNLQPDMQYLQQLPYRGIDVTAPGSMVDFVSRTFYPKKVISEDPVCGAAHCILVPYWAQQLKKNYLNAYQVSQRGGELFCFFRGEHIVLGGKALIYLQGSINKKQLHFTPS